MNKGMRISLAVAFLLGTLALARGQMAWAGSQPEALAGQGAVSQGGMLSTSNQASGTLTATLSEIVGSVQVQQAGSGGFIAATEGYVLQDGGQVQTGDGAKVRLDLSTGSIVRVGPNTHFTLQAKQDASNGLFANFQLTLGKVWVTLTGGAVQVETTSGVAAVQGSLMTVIFDSTTGLIKIICIEGHCYLINATGKVSIITGQTAFTHSNNEFPQIGPINLQDTQDWYDNNPGAGGPVAPSTQAGTVKTPGITVPGIGAPGVYSVGGVCTFRIIQALDEGYSLTADLLPFESLGKNPPEILSDLAGVCRAIYEETTAGIIKDLGTHGQVEVCFAPVPNTKGVIYVYNPYQTEVGPAQGETYTPLDTKSEDGLLCAPSQQTGKYFLASVKP
jgi:hypothetical protein